MNELHSLSALRQAADYLRAEERHWWADMLMAAIETLTRDDNMAEVIERVRALHQETVYDSFWTTDRHCRECSNDWPCPTIQALSRSADPAPVDPVLDETDKRDRSCCDRKRNRNPRRDMTLRDWLGDEAYETALIQAADILSHRFTGRYRTEHCEHDYSLILAWEASADPVELVLEAVLPDLLAKAWDQGHRASERDWEMAYDLTTPDEDRQPWPNPYRRQEAEA